MSESTANLIINYLPQTMTDSQFQNLFDSIGPTQSCRIIRDKNTGYSFGYGFVEYKDSKHAKLAISTLNGYKIQHKTLKVSYSRSGGDKIKNTNLFVSNIPAEISEQQLEKAFAQFGEVIQCRLLKDSKGDSRGIAFIRYNLHEDAQSALSSLNDTCFPGTSQQISVKVTTENDKKQKEIIQKFTKIKSIADSGGFYVDPSSQRRGFPLNMETATGILSRNPLAAVNYDYMGYGGGDGYPMQHEYAPPHPPMYGARKTSSAVKQMYGGKIPKMNAAAMKSASSSYSDPPPFMYGMTRYSDLSGGSYPPTNPYYNSTNGSSAAYMGPGSGYFNMASMKSTSGGPGPSIIPLTGGRGGIRGGKRGAFMKQQQHYSPNNGNVIGSASGGRPPPHPHHVVYDHSAVPGITTSAASTVPGSTMFVYNIGPKTTEKELLNLFWPYGTVVKVDIPKDPKSTVGDNRGYGFVSMSTVDEAELAIQYLNNFTFKEKPLQVSLKKD